MKTVPLRSFLKTAVASLAAVFVTRRAPAPTTLLEGAAALCVVLTVTAAGIVCIVRLCRPRYTLYYGINEDKTTNSGREYVCLSCSKAEAQNRNLTPCQGPKFDLAACQAQANIANTNWEAVACGPIATEPPLHAQITLESTTNPTGNSWAVAAPPQTMNLNDDGAQVTFTLPRYEGSMFFRAKAVEI